MKNNITQWVNSTEFQTTITGVLTNIQKGAVLAKSEADIASVFEKEIYYLLRKLFNITLNIQKEVTISGVLHSFGSLTKRKSGRGRLDAVINSLIIEYKHPSKLTTVQQKQTAIEQVKAYIYAMDHKCSAVLTDGLKIAYFDYVGNEIRNTRLRNLSKDDLELIIHALIDNNSKKLDPQNIVSDFAISPHYESTSRNLARTLFNTLISESTQKTLMLFEEWKGLMHLSVDDNGKSADITKRRTDLSGIFNYAIKTPENEYKALFALQTTYAIIVKLIACKVVDSINVNGETKAYSDLIELSSEKLQQLLQMMEDGYTYQNNGIRNFLEGDFFSWYADVNQWMIAFFESIRELIYTTDEYSAFSFNVQYNPIDIFKDLYMAIIPQSIRHSMGEYFTPEWLADGVVSKGLELLQNKKDWKAIDPCCGSGIFIVTLIKKVVGDLSIVDLTKEERTNLIEQILNRVYGIDINPLSVLSARVSYFLALHRLGDITGIEIPIFLGDSAIIPTTRIIDEIPCYTYSINNLKNSNINIVLPKRFVRSSDFGKNMSILQSLVNAENTEAIYNVIYNNLTKNEQTSLELQSCISELAYSLVFLHKMQWDGIWIRIAMNFMMIARLESFDLIVGNPPWVKWEHLPSAYTRKIKQFCDIRHIFCNDGGMYGGAQLNICALIANVTASNWLNPSGILAFLMPDSIMSQNSYEEFRNFYIDYNKNKRLYLQFLDRWVPPLRPFKVGNKTVSQDFNTYYYSSNYVNYKKGIPVRVIGKKKGIIDTQFEKSFSFNDIQNDLTISFAVAKQLANKSTAFTYLSSEYDFEPIIGESEYLYRTGVESTPFEVFKLVEVGGSNKNGYHRFRNKSFKASKYKVDDTPYNGWDFPTDYIYPMLEGPNLMPFSYDCGKNYHIIPYKENDTSSPIPLTELAISSPELAVYFSNHKVLLSSQSEKSKTMHRGEEFYALSKIGPYTFAPYIVAARDNSSFCAAVVKPSMTAWGETKKTICVKHTIIISQDSHGNFIDENEAHYINGILNSSIVHAYIHSTFKTNGFSLNKAHLFIPKYISNDSLFVKISEVSRRATSDSFFREEAPKILTDIYLSLCKKYNKT